MIISDLNHLETISDSQTSKIAGGGFVLPTWEIKIIDFSATTLEKDGQMIESSAGTFEVNGAFGSFSSTSSKPLFPKSGLTEI